MSGHNTLEQDILESCTYLNGVRCRSVECSTCSKYYEYKQVKDFEYKQRKRIKLMMSGGDINSNVSYN